MLCIPASSYAERQREGPKRPMVWVAGADAPQEMATQISEAMANLKPTSKRHDPSHYPEPLIVPALSGVHKHSIILLHGRGSNASTFGPPFLTHSIPGFEGLSFAFPDTKFIFPTASFRRARIYKRKWITQWFDNWALSTSTAGEELQIAGLRGSIAFIHGLLRAEIEAVGAENVSLGGPSQGCATSLISILAWEGEPFKAAFGMCGWLPYRSHLEEITSDDVRSRESDPFANEEKLDANVPLPEIALEWLREELEIPLNAPSMAFQRIPLFLGHGSEDEKVFVHLGREAARCLGRMGMDVRWKEYDGLGHWYSEDMLCDIVDFLKETTGWAVDSNQN